MPDDQLLFAAGLNDLRRTIARVRRGRQRPPNFPSRVLVECDDYGARSTDRAEQFVAIDERMSAKAPYGRFDVVLLLQVLRPQRLAALGIEAMQIALRAECIDFSAANGRRCPRST